METAMGHMHKIKQGTKSTKVSLIGAITNTDGIPTPGMKQNTAHDLRIHTIYTDTFEDSVSPDRLKELLATYLPGRYPVTWARGHKYLFVMYDYDANYIYATPSSPEHQRNSSEALLRATRYSHTTCFHI